MGYKEGWAVNIVRGAKDLAYAGRPAAPFFGQTGRPLNGGTNGRQQQRTPTSDLMQTATRRGTSRERNYAWYDKIFSDRSDGGKRSVAHSAVNPWRKFTHLRGGNAEEKIRSHRSRYVLQVHISLCELALRKSARYFGADRIDAARTRKFSAGSPEMIAFHSPHLQ